MGLRSQLFACALSALSGLVTPVLVPCALGTQAQAQTMRGDVHEDLRFGFRVKPPKDWKGIAVPSGQAWVIGKYLSEKRYFYTEKGSYTYEFQPEMAIVAFIAPDVKKAARKKAKEEAKDEEQRKQIEDEIERMLESDYRDYKDYLTKTYQGGGFFFTKEEPGELNGVRTTVYEAKVEKSSRSGPKRIVTWVYSLPEVDIAVQIEIFEQDYDKLGSLLDGVFRSFKAVPREGELPVLQGQLGSRIYISLEELEEMTPGQRGLMRMQEQSEAHAKAVAGLAEGWRQEKIGRILVVSRADERFDKRVAEQATAVFDWLEKTFSYVGPGEYVREPIIRVCKDAQEESSFRGSAGWADFAGLGLECTINKEYGGTRSSEFEYVNRFMIDLWFTDRDRDLWWGMPNWLKTGITRMGSSATNKNGKLDFYRDDYTAQMLRDMVKEGEATVPKDLMHRTGNDFWGKGDGFGRMAEAHALVDYLMAGAGSKGKTKDLVKNYILNLEAVLIEIEEEGKLQSEVEEKPKTEEEEEKALRAQRERLEQREQELIDEVGARTFAGWGDKEWNELAKNYFKSI